MNIIMHLMFSYNMRKIIRRESGAKLNLIGFMYGNILPDISSSFNNQPHNIKGSLNYIIMRAHILLKGASLKDSSYSYNDSRDLGIITHYLSDFFCYPHQEHYSKGFKDHSIYELKMLVKYRKGLKKYREMFERSYHHLSPEDFKKWILEKHLDYTCQKCSSIDDISHAIYTGTMIGKSMISNCRNIANDVVLMDIAGAQKPVHYSYD